MSAEAATVREGTIASADGLGVYWRAWLPNRSPRAILGVVHGHGEHSGRYAAFAEWFTARGYAVYAGDLRGHGRSDGARGHARRWDDLIADALAVQRVAGAEVSDIELVPVGHSVGGSIVLSAVLRGRMRPRRFIVSSPALRVAQPVPAWKLRASAISSRVLPSLSLPTGLDAAGISRDTAVVAAYRNDPFVHSKMSSRFFMEWTAANREVLERASEIAVPFLATHGRADPIIDVRATEELCGRAGVKATLRVYDEMLHEPYNEIGRETVYSDVLEWLERAS